MNKQQLDIIQNSDFIQDKKKVKQALCIIACAGSGKTTTIINKVVYMIKYLNCSPSDFVLTTFTKNAAEEIIKRIRQQLDNEIVNNMTIGTFHAIALDEIKKNNYKIEPNMPESMPEEYLINYIELMNNKTYIAPFKYLFIDEYQDINEFQYDIIKKWYLQISTKLLVVVGDDQQNIYTFRNTSIKYILNFCKDFNGKYKYLNTNYRCNKGIVDMTNAIITFNTDKIPKKIIAGNKDDIILPKIRFFKNDKAEKEAIQDHINKIYTTYSVTDQTKPTIAILSRTNKKLYKVENFLELNNIPTQLLTTNTDTTNTDITNILNKEISSESIILSTIHGSKGLEFDYVIIMNCVDGSFPIIGADLQEERRLFYVACTRAKKGLFITSLWFDKFKPSRFIYELYNSFNDLIDIKNFEWKENTYEDLINKRSNKLSDILNNMNINIYIDLKTQKILPPEQYINFNSKNIHSHIDPYKIIRHSNTTDLETIFSNMMNLQVERMIQELVNTNEYIYLPYIKNDQIFQNNKYSLRHAIRQFTEETTHTTHTTHTSCKKDLEKHIEYFKKQNSNFIIPISGSDSDNKFLTNILNLLSEPDFLTAELNLLTKTNRLTIADSYAKFKNHIYKSIDIIDDILNLSLINELNKGRYSLQLLLSNVEFINKLDLIEHLININDWLRSNISSAEYIDFNYDIIINKCNIGKINLIIDNHMIVINAKNSQKPSINEFIKYLLFLSKYNSDNSNKLTIIQYYNPIAGKIFEWDLSDTDTNLNGQSTNELLNYFINLKP
jgi:hypothetical protein